MGFETENKTIRPKRILGFEHTLWDLKQTKKVVTHFVYDVFEHTLWDLKRRPYCATINEKGFEHTLWDLKPLKGIDALHDTPV